MRRRCLVFPSGVSSWDEFSQDELRQLDPNLSREYTKGVLVRENGHTTNPHRLVERLLQASSATAVASSGGAQSDSRWSMTG